MARRARCATGGVPEVVHRREAWEPFGAKNQYGPPDNATRPPAPHEGHARRRPAHATAHASCPRRERAHTTTSARQPTMWRHGIVPNETSMLPVHIDTPATRDDVPAQMSGTGRAESTLGSCPASLEHPSISWNTSTCLLECGRLCNPCCSMDSGILHLRADAGATEPRRRAINEQQALAHNLTRDSAQSGPTTSRTRRFGDRKAVHLLIR